MKLALAQVEDNGIGMPNVLWKWEDMTTNTGCLQR